MNGIARQHDHGHTVPCHFFSQAGGVGQFATRVVQELPAIARFWGRSLRTISLPMFTNLPEEVAWHQPLFDS